MQLDAIDHRILYRLQENSQLSNQDLAEQVALSPSACLRRVRALEESGLIRGYRAVLDAERLGFELEAVVHVSLDQSRAGWHEEFLAGIALYDEITEASIVTGASNYILTVRTRNCLLYTSVPVTLSDAWASRQLLLCVQSRDTLSARARRLLDHLLADAAPVTPPNTDPS